MGICHSLSVYSIIRRQKLSFTEINNLDIEKLYPIKNKILARYEKSDEFYSWKTDLEEFRDCIAKYIFGNNSIEFPYALQDKIRNNVINGSYCIYLIVNQKMNQNFCNDLDKISNAVLSPFSNMQVYREYYEFLRELKNELVIFQKINNIVKNMECFDVEPIDFDNFEIKKYCGQSLF